MPKFWT